MRIENSRLSSKLQSAEIANSLIHSPKHNKNRVLFLFLHDHPIKKDPKGFRHENYSVESSESKNAEIQ